MPCSTHGKIQLQALPNRPLLLGGALGPKWSRNWTFLVEERRTKRDSGLMNPLRLPDALAGALIMVLLLARLVLGLGAESFHIYFLRPTWRLLEAQ